MDGYSRYRQQGPWSGPGELVGSLIAWYLTRPLHERQKAVKEMTGAMEVAIMTGDKEPLEALSREYPTAVKPFEKQTGIPYPAPAEGTYGVEVPPFPPQMTAGGPPQLAPPTMGRIQAPGMPAGGMVAPMAPGGQIVPPAAGAPPPTAEAARREEPLPWPSTREGITVRAIHESMAGRQLPAPVSAALGIPPPMTPTEQYMQHMEFLGDLYKASPGLAMAAAPQLQWPFPFTAPSSAAFTGTGPGYDFKISDLRTALEIWTDITPAEIRRLQEHGELPNRPPTPPEKEGEKTVSTAEWREAMNIYTAIRQQGSTDPAELAMTSMDIVRGMRTGTLYAPSYFNSLLMDANIVYQLRGLMMAKGMMASGVSDSVKRQGAKLYEERTKELFRMLGLSYVEAKSVGEKIIEMLMGQYMIQTAPVGSSAISYVQRPPEEK